jgi:hypothetical protein
MERLLWTGEPGFFKELKPCGWPETAYLNMPEKGQLCWDELVEKAGFVPDVMVVAPGKHLPFVLGMENFPCLTIFYSTASETNVWHNLYAQAYDACLVSYFDHVERFIGPFMPRERVWWSPPYAREEFFSGGDDKRELECLFIGEEASSKEFLEAVQKKLPGIHLVKDVQDGRKAAVLLDHGGEGDPGFRTFEALGSGNCLVTPRGGEGQHQLFVDGEHIVLYKPEDAGDAFYRIDFLLKHPKIAEYIRNTARDEVNSRHLSRHRAEALTDNLCDLAMQDVGALVDARLERAPAIRKSCLQIPYLIMAGKTTGEERASFEAAARGEYGLSGP